MSTSRFLSSRSEVRIRFRVRAKLSSGELAVRGDQWPLLMYANQKYDPEDPWDGLFRSRLLVWVV